LEKFIQSQNQPLIEESNEETGDKSLRSNENKNESPAAPDKNK